LTREGALTGAPSLFYLEKIMAEVELTLLELDLLSDSDIRLNRALAVLGDHLIVKKDLETAKLLVPVLTEVLQQSEIIRDAMSRAVAKGEKKD
jgi:hypothetical protein